MENILYLSPTHEIIIEWLVIGHSHQEIAKKLNIKLGTLYSYIRNMNFNNDTTIYQLIWMYAHKENYQIKSLVKHSKYQLKVKINNLNALNH
jgi:DNA-binding CsgD family transcriptional regulator